MTRRLSSQSHEGAEDGGLGQFLAKGFAEFDRGLDPARLIAFHTSVRPCAGGGGIVLPASEGKDVGEVLGRLGSGCSPAIPNRFNARMSPFAQ